MVALWCHVVDNSFYLGLFYVLLQKITIGMGLVVEKGKRQILLQKKDRWPKWDDGHKENGRKEQQGRGV